MGQAATPTTFVDTPPARLPLPPDWGGIVRKVEVTITAVTTERISNNRANVPVRTTLVTTITPRSAAAAFVGSGVAGAMGEWE
jgi:hypothetical protein